MLLDSYTLKFFVSGAYIETLAPFYGNMYSYGIGFADVKDHDYYKGILGDNKLLIETCLTFAGDNVSTDCKIFLLTTLNLNIVNMKAAFSK